MAAKSYMNKIDGQFSIELPFRLNEQQLEAARELDDFIGNPKEKVITLSGYAGTGKTTLMEIMARKCYGKKSVHFCATTHKAAGVLREKVGTKVTTVNSLFGILVRTDMDGDHYDVSRKSTENGDDKVKPGSVIVIDEASMLSERNYMDIVSKADFKKCKIIFVGDPAQLSPVNEDQVSIVFRNPDIRVIGLTEVMRTDDDSILEESMNVRNTGNLSYETHVDKKGNGVEYIGNSDVDRIRELIGKHVQGLKKDPNHFRILTYTNSNVNALNTMIRKMLGHSGSVPVKGEPLMAYSNWGYEGMTGYGPAYAVVNSEAYVCEGIVNEHDENIRDMITNPMDFGTDDFNVHITDMKIRDCTGKRKTVPLIDVRDNPRNAAAVRILAEEKKYQWSRYRTCESRTDRMKCLDKINAIDGYLFINDNVYDRDGYLVQEKCIDFGYAHTIHKSQGSTFGYVMINDYDIERCRDVEVRRQLRYVGVTRARKSVMIITKK